MRLAVIHSSVGTKTSGLIPVKRQTSNVKRSNNENERRLTEMGWDGMGDRPCVVYACEGGGEINAPQNLNDYCESKEGSQVIQSTPALPTPVSGVRQIGYLGLVWVWCYSAVG